MKKNGFQILREAAQDGGTILVAKRIIGTNQNNHKEIERC